MNCELRIVNWEFRIANLGGVNCNVILPDFVVNFLFGVSLKLVF